MPHTDLSHSAAVQPPRHDGRTRFDLSLIYEEIGAPPPFPLDVLPRLWGPWCEGAAGGASTAVDYVALALLGSAASLIGSSRRVTPAPGWSEPCTLWTVLVGPPSSGKTPAVDAVLRLMRTLEPSPGADGTPAPPSLPVVFGANGIAGIQAMAGVLRHAPRGVLLTRDEHGDWLGQMVRGSRDSRAHTLWRAAWAGRAWSMTLPGRRIALDDPAVSIVGTTQPEALEAALARDHDGMMARFLFVRPPRDLPRPLPATDTAVSPEAAAALRRLHALPAARRDLALATEARDAFEAFRVAHYEPRDDVAGRAADWWGKGPGTVLRLAGVLTFLDWAAQPAGTAEPALVPGWALRRAAALWRDVLWPHAQATLRIAGAGGERERHMRKVLHWLQRHGPHTVSRETLRRDALGQALDAAGTDRVIDSLVEGGWLERAPAPGTRGRPPLRWHVCQGLRSRPQPASPALHAADGPGAATGIAPPARSSSRAAPAMEDGAPPAGVPAIPADPAPPPRAAAPPAPAVGAATAAATPPPPARDDTAATRPLASTRASRMPGQAPLPAVSAPSRNTGAHPRESDRASPAVASGPANGTHISYLAARY